MIDAAPIRIGFKVSLPSSLYILHPLHTYSLPSDGDDDREDDGEDETDSEEKRPLKKRGPKPGWLHD